MSAVSLASRGSMLRAAFVGLFAIVSACASKDQTPSGTLGGSGAGTDAGGPASGGSSSAGTASGGSSAGAGATGGSSEGGTSPLGGAGSSGAGGLSPSAGAGAGAGGGPAFVLTSPAFENVTGCAVETPKVCGVFPDANVSYMGNANTSPELHWTGAPPGTKSFALVLFDATFGQAHWALWNIPADTTTLAADVAKDTATPPVPPGSRQANANFATTGGDGYFGPHIPCNVFELQLYALSLSSFEPAEPESAVLVDIELQDLGAPVLGIAKLTGRSNDYTMTCE